ncbi:hypothetical protein [Polyangium spumosum]|uniref:Tetratricopeptide repeat protein n=1 Tax=Polyangium spumosum TaxID=889282 RepID=A0A6N7PPM4_9BACT|nr:hypothetical protein [Polyangium spumosum]MRG92300.1 hypothetical protein [Polyangium spumosum]
MRVSSRGSLFVLFGLLGAPSLLAPRAAASDGGIQSGAAEVGAPLLEGMGSHRRPITTRVPAAQRYFDQGLTLAYGFNHAEAERSFLAAARLDPSCAMCSWGAALVLGPNINAAMKDADVPRAYAHLERALALAPGAAPREQALIQALAKRYTKEPVADRAPLDRAYADAMGEVARRFPDDVDILALHAEALMDLSPWKYWEGGAPRANTQEIIGTLERAMRLDPNHPGANHYYIHVMEASTTPERALDAANRLAHLVPGAGHLVHMPGHIYIRVGMYHEAALANERAILADNRYARHADPANFYLRMYRMHNPHFLWFATTLEGRSADALRAARLLVAMIGEGSASGWHGGHGGGGEVDVMTEHFLATPLYAMVRFGRWRDILREAAPPLDRPYSRGVYHYASAIAHSRLGDEAAALGHLANLGKYADLHALAESTVSGVNSPKAVLSVAYRVASGELAADRGDLEGAIRQLEMAVKLEDGLRYMEPADWHHPTRQILGAILLRAGKAAEAERVYREDLANLPENGYSLFGLAQALEGQGKAIEAAEVRRRFEVAFARADIRLEASRF